MKRCILELSLTVTISLAANHAHAQIFFKKPRTAPEAQPAPAVEAASERQKIAEAMFAAKNDPDERKRSRAIGALEGVDAKNHPEAATLLAEIALKESQPHLRMDAMSALARLRPMSGIAAHTLEKAAETDAAWRNRVHAKTLSLRYNLTYRPAKDDPVAAANPVPTQTQPPVRSSITPLPTVTNRVPTNNIQLPIIRDAEAAKTPPSSNPPVLDTIPDFQPVPTPMPGPVTITPQTPNPNGTPRFVPLPAYGGPKLTAPTGTGGSSISPQLPKIVEPTLPLPLDKEIIVPAPGGDEPDIVIPALPGGGPLVPAPTSRPGGAVAPSAPVEFVPIPSLPGAPANPAPTPAQPPRAPVQPMPQDDVVLPPKF